MNTRDRTRVAKNVAANVAAAGVFAVGAAVAAAATASADPPPPVPADPAAAEPAAAEGPATITGPGGVPLGPGGFPIAGYAAPGQDLLLSQRPIPGVSGGEPAGPLSTDVLNANQFLSPLNYKFPTGNEPSPYALSTVDPVPGTLNGIRGSRAFFHSVMGKTPVEQLGDPLPGTAPPPGTNIPAGIGNNLPDLPPPGAPPAPAPAPPPAG